MATTKHPSQLNDREFEQAVRNCEWRHNPVPRPEPTPIRKPVADMNDAEFTEAVKNQAWRNK